MGAFCALGSLLKLMLAQHQALTHGFWSPASIRNLAFTFTDLFPHVLFPLVAVLCVAALWAPKRKSLLVVSMAPHEQLCWLFALVPVSGLVLGRLTTHAFVSRYFIGVLPAFAVGIACLIWRYTAGTGRTAAVALVFFAVFGLGQQFEHVLHPSGVRPIPATGELDRMQHMLALERQTPTTRFLILRPGDLLSLETHYYAQHPERIVFLLGPGESAPDPHAPLGTGENRPIIHWTIEELGAHAGEATLIDPAPETLGNLLGSGHRAIEHYDGVLNTVDVQ